MIEFILVYSKYIIYYEYNIINNYRVWKSEFIYTKPMFVSGWNLKYNVLSKTFTSHWEDFRSLSKEQWFSQPASGSVQKEK